MDSYVTGAAIRHLRERKNMTQADLARLIGVSSKTVSKWETGRGLPDISLLEPLARSLGISLSELVSGAPVANRNTSANLLRSGFYVCPVCGNIIHAAGESVISCCGISLPPLEAEEVDAAHSVSLEPVEDEFFVTVSHAMTKSHYISFLAFLTSDRLQMVKLYPEGNAETRFQIRGHGWLYLFCNQHGLMKKRI